MAGKNAGEMFNEALDPKSDDDGLTERTLVEDSNSIFDHEHDDDELHETVTEGVEDGAGSLDDEDENPQRSVAPGRFREVNTKRREAETALAQERQRREDLERQLQAFQRQPIQPPQPAPAPEKRPIPDMLADPEGWQAYVIEQAQAPLRQELRQTIVDNSRFYAVDKFGQETVTLALQAADAASKAGDPSALALDAHVRQSRTPFQDIVHWYNNRQVAETVGGDLEAYRRRIIQEALESDPEFRAQFLNGQRPAPRGNAQTPGRQPVSRGPQGLPSLTRASSGRSANEEDITDPGEMFADALKPGRARR